MKWFKHQANARNDERISQLEDKCGIEGYGFYFKMLEIVAEVIDATDRHEVVYSLTRWGRQANITSKKFLFLSQCCADVGLMIVQRDGDNITVKIPKLLKYRDNHTKNLQATCKQEEEREEDKERDKEEEKDVENTSPQQAGEVVDIQPCPHQEIIALYAKNLPTLTQVKVWTDARRKLLAARWREDSARQSLDWWDRFFRYVATSDFLLGKTSTWQCDIEWILKSSNFIKILEGKYENKVAA